MKGKLELNPTMSLVWDYMHPDLRNSSGVPLVQEMVVMDKLAYFYSQYFVEFAFFENCRKCLPFIGFLSIRSKNKDLLPEHCALNTEREIVLFEKRWVPKAREGQAITEQDRGEAFVRKLGLRYLGTRGRKSMPRTFEDCMKAIQYQ